MHGINEPNDSFIKKYKFDQDICDICHKPLSSARNHVASCLPCGHVYGFSCIMGKEIVWPRFSVQCPRCNSIHGMEDIRLIFSPPMWPIENLIQKTEHLEAENEFLDVELKIIKELKDLAARRSKLSEMVEQLNSESEASSDAPTILQNQHIEERDDELSEEKPYGMEMPIQTLKDELLAAHHSEKLPTEILERLREIEVRSSRAEDLISRLEGQNLEQCSCILKASYDIISARTPSFTYGISVEEVVHLLVKLSEGASLNSL